jgi:restriction system protein
MQKDQTMWMVRAGEGAYYIEDFLEKKVVAIGWNKVGNFTSVKSPEQAKEKVRAAYPDLKDGQVNIFAATLFKFKNEFQPGQLVLTYDPGERLYWIGEITSEYQFKPKDLEDLPHTRSVRWTQSVSRDILSTKTKNSLGSTVTIFKISPQTIEELLAGTTNSPAYISQENLQEIETLDEIKEDIEARAIEFIKDKVTKLNWEDMQELVAGILRGMGYKTFISPKGADRGRDIIASPDGLGLENPKITVEVKHRGGAMGGPEIRSFLGGLRTSDRGLYVSTGGFTKDAKYEAERANVPLTLVDLDMLVHLIVQHYDNFDTDTRSLIPLKKIYWPFDS